MLTDVTVLQGGVEKTLKVGAMISDHSYFDIHKFARMIEAKVLEKKGVNDFVATLVKRDYDERMKDVDI